jgi:hypothetical protein
MKTIVAVCLVLVLSGCASQRNVVRCDGRLEPINTPRAAQTLELAGSEVDEAEGGS